MRASSPTRAFRFIDQATWLAVNDYEWELIRDRTGLSEDEAQAMLDALIITRGSKGSEIHAGGKRIEIPVAKPSRLGLSASTVRPTRVSLTNWY